jgi:hypothetical protein
MSWLSSFISNNKGWLGPAAGIAGIATGMPWLGVAAQGAIDINEGGRKRPAGPGGPGVTGSTNGGTPPALQDPSLQDYYTKLMQGGGAGSDLTGEAGKRMLAFNPQEAMNTSAQGTWANLRPQLTGAVRSLRGSQAGVGRLQSGFASEDENQVYRQGGNYLANAVAGNALQAAGMTQKNNADLYGVGADERNFQGGMVTGQLDRNVAERNAERQRQSQQGATNAQNWATAGNVVGSIAGKIPWDKVGSWASGLWGNKQPGGSGADAQYGY